MSLFRRSAGSTPGTEMPVLQRTPRVAPGASQDHRWPVGRSPQLWPLCGRGMGQSMERPGRGHCEVPGG